MKLVNNANKIATNKLEMNNVKDIYDNLKKTIKEKNKTSFASNLQTYITKIAIILSECIIDLKLTNHYFADSLKYICLKVVKNKQLYDLLIALKINPKGNDVKHKVKNVNIDFELTIQQYNNLIKAIIDTTKLTAFNKCYLNKKNTNETTGLSKELYSRSFYVGGNNFFIELSPNGVNNKYQNTLTTEVTLTHRSNSSSALKKIIDLTIYEVNSKNRKQFYRWDLHTTCYSSNHACAIKNVHLMIPTKYLNANILNIVCEVTITEMKYGWYLGGDPTENNEEKFVETVTIPLSQIYNPK